MRRRFRHLRTTYSQRVWKLLLNPTFWMLTIIGNTMILVGSFLLWIFEANWGMRNLSFLDSLLWGTSLVTTVGYVNYFPETVPGKITVLSMMLLGILFLWSYMAFLVTALISPSLHALEKEVEIVEKDIETLQTEQK